MHIAIVGCGVAGMSAALALTRLGHDVELLERVRQPGPVGAGLLLQPTGLAALDALRLGEEARRWGARVLRLTGDTTSGRAIMRLRYEGAHGLGIHRGALFTILYDAVRAEGVTVRTGLQASAIDVSNPSRPAIVFAGGRRGEAYDFLLAADGASSVLRPSITAKARAPEYPWGAFWAILPDPERRWRWELRQVYDGCSIMAGVMPVGRAPNGDGEQYVTFFWSLKTTDMPAVRAAGLDALRDNVAKYWPAGATLLDHVSSMDELAEARYRDVRAAAWTNGHAALIGDAAHGTSPQLGQGANLALLDALALARAIGPAHERRDPRRALRRWRRARARHTAYYQFMSRFLTPLYQSDSRALAWVRDATFGLLGALPVTGEIMRATLDGRATFGLGAWRGPWEP